MVSERLNGLGEAMSEALRGAPADSSAVRESLMSFGAAGSDVAGIRSTAVKDGDGWRINGTKLFITNAVYGDLSIVAARTNPDNRYGI